MFLTKLWDLLCSPLTSKSNRLTPDMKAAIKKIPKRGALTFSSIKVKGPSGSPFVLDGGAIFKLM